MATNNDLLRRIEHAANFNEKEKQEGLAKLAENYVYHFAWAGQKIWELSFKLDYYRAILEDVSGGQQPHISIAFYKNQLQDFTSRSYNVREESSGALHREASVWKFKASMELAQEFTSLLNELNEK